MNAHTPLKAEDVRLSVPGYADLFCADPLRWYETPRAVELIASIVADPPRMRSQLAGLDVCLAAGREVYREVFDPNDDRVDELGMMSNAAFLDVEAREGAGAYLWEWIGAQAAIARAHVAERNREFKGEGL